jgi:hypothetical protein
MAGVLFRDVLHDPGNRKVRQKQGSDIGFEEISIDVKFGPVLQDDTWRNLHAG